MYTKWLVITLIGLALIGFTACENNINEVKEVTQKLAANIETIEEVSMMYSESAIIRVRLEAPKLLRHKTEKPFTEFPEGLKLIFFGDSLKMNSILTANYGVRYEKEQKTVVKDKVVWLNEEKNERLETEELTWNERTKKIYSDKFVKITTNTESIFGEGFEAEQDFSRYKIKKITGTVQVKAGEFTNE